jgi:hypothetical protein
MSRTVSSTSWPRQRRGLQLVEQCGQCHLSPCACDYIRRLRPTADLADLRDVALECFSLPFPHRLGCPCPACWSARLRSWEGS